jgi:uncharacterized protein YbdZ (MbtH family)
MILVILDVTCRAGSWAILLQSKRREASTILMEYEWRTLTPVFLKMYEGFLASWLKDS